ncbi:hypothetical protein ACQEU6_06585 [Spirillospora sp. CA-108201]
MPERFVRALDVFEAVLAGTPADRWLSPSPCEGWAAVDVAGHVTAGLLVVELRAAGRPLPEDDPDWHEVAGADPLELLVHAWDLAQATGQSVVFDADLVGPALATAREMAPGGREAGMLGPEVAVPGDAGDQARLLALFGRSPVGA